MRQSARPRVVIVGAGFGGLTLAQELRKAPVDVLLIDRHNYHTFQPLLYQVATAGLEPEEIAHAVRGIFHRQRNFRFRMATVSEIDWRSKSVIAENGDRIPYDYLAIAAGVSTNFFGVPGADSHSLELKGIEHAVKLRSHIIRQFELADRHIAADAAGRLTFVVVGGGPTGVETAGALIELFHLVLKKDYPDLPITLARVVLLEATPHVLGTYHERLRTYTVRKLEERGVEVRLGDPVVLVTEDGVHLKSGEVILTHTTIWTAGVRTGELAGRLKLQQTTGGRIVVIGDLSVPEHPDVFVIGDMAATLDAEGRLNPQVAPVAIQGARHVARTIEARLAGRASAPFLYRDPGIMATIGRNSAVVQFPGGLKATGFVAWMMWLGLHLIQLIGFRNRLNVLINWAWNYFTYDRSARLIIDRDPRDVQASHSSEPIRSGGC